MSDFSGELLSWQDPATLSGKVTLEVTDGVAVIRMLCGENRLNVRTVGLLLDALEQVER